MVLQALREVLEADYRGPRAVFTQVDVLKALMAIGSAGHVGRGRLGTVTGLGQGEVRTLIKRMKERRLIEIESDGCRLSKKGERHHSMISSILLWSGPVDGRSLRIGDECWGILVRGTARSVRFGIEQRDAAVKAGADGAFTSIFASGKFMVPGDSADAESGGSKEPWTTLHRAAPREGDVAVVAGSTDIASAENGALAAMLTLV